MKHRMIRLFVTASLLVAGTLVFAAATTPTQYKNAIELLQKAQAELQAAPADKGGHRSKALDNTRAAIEEAKKAMATVGQARN